MLNVYNYGVRSEGHSHTNQETQPLKYKRALKYHPKYIIWGNGNPTLMGSEA